jgi:tRNA-Thr(GGU) m(6)t(6)A37 methyltransferase TsaA
MPVGNQTERRFQGNSQDLHSFRSIGHVEAANANDTPTQDIESESLIVLQRELAGGLDGISPGDRLMVIFVFDRAREYELRQHPRGNPHRPRRGVFSLRSPRRPNPIGVTVVEVLEITENKIRVRGLDAWPSTPILDLKPGAKEQK